MQKRRTVTAVLSAFILTVCVLCAAGALLQTDIRVGRLLFGDTYVSVTLSENTIPETVTDRRLWLPVRLRMLLDLPRVVADGVEFLLSKR